MKRVLYTLGVALALASCGSNEYQDWAAPQSNAEESPITVAFAATPAAAINFNTVTTDSVALFTPKVSTTASVAKQGLNATLFSADKSTSVVLAASATGNVKASELQKAIETLYGKSDVVRTVETLVTDTIHMAGGTGYVKTSDKFNSTINLVKTNYGEFVYEVGNESEWQTAHALHSANFDGIYEGYYYLNGLFKFRPNADNWDNALGYVSDGKIASSASGNVPDPGAGFYKINVDLSAGTYSLTKIESISIIGSVYGNWDKDFDLTYNTSNGAWEGTVTLTTGEMKFRANHEWDLSWGGKSTASDFTNLTANNSKNLKIETAGTYKVQLFISYDGANKVILTPVL